MLATVIGTAGYGFGFAYARRFVNRLSPLQLSTGQLTAPCLALLPFAGFDVAAGSVHQDRIPGPRDPAAPEATAVPQPAGAAVPAACGVPAGAGGGPGDAAADPRDASRERR